MTDANPAIIFPDFLADFCAHQPDGPSDRALGEAVARLAPSDRAAFFALSEELIGVSPKSAAIGFKKLPGVIESIGPEALSWLDLGIGLASQSSAAAQKFFSESPEILPRIKPANRPLLLKLGLELSEDAYVAVTDFIRACAHLPDGIAPEALTLWAQTGRRLAEEDRVLSVEYFRISPQVLSLLTITDLPLWVKLGRSLVEPNSIGKPDYLKAIEYFHLSAETLAALDPPDLRRPFLELGSVLARRSAGLGMDFLRSCASRLQPLDSPIHRRLFLSQGLRLAETALQEPSVVLDYLKEGPKMFEALGQDTTDFIAWVDAGLALLSRNVERARAYFSGRSKTGEETTERLIGGVSLKAVGRMLTLYAEGLSGRSVTIKPTAELPEDPRETAVGSPTTDGRTIYLPSRIRFSPDDRENFMLYKISTLHETGHIEFGTYEPRLNEIRDTIEAVRAEYPPGPDHADEIKTAADYFRLFPNPAWARSLWTILEDARVDYRLRLEYPGARREMDRIVAMELQSRPPLEGLPPRMAVHEALLQLSITDTTEAPLELADAVSGAYDLLLELKKPNAVSTDSLRVLARLYRFLEEQLRRFPSVQGEADPLGAQEKSSIVESDPASPRNPSGTASVSTTLSYRGAMHPDWIRSDQEKDGKTVPVDQARLKSGPPESPPRSEAAKRTLQESRAETARKEKDSPPGSKSGSTRPSESAEAESRIFFYDEWDEGAQEYRPQWCRLYEHRLRPESGRIVRETLSAHAPVLRLLRRHFQGLRPEAFRKIKRQVCGDQLDLDAVVEARTDLRGGRTPPEGLYIKNEKRNRDVAVAFLIDMSGSTSRRIPSVRRRVIEIEQEALILMSEALQAVGDAFAIYGFSGDSKDRVDFFVMKDFSDAFNPGIHERIGAMKPLNQNRDGAAIRHALAKLEQQPAKTRLLILLSDGKPLDADYSGTYSLHDAKRALREARMRGVHPYCITIDQEASRYAAEMYGEVHHTIIDQAAALPERLPRIYKRLTT